MFVSFAALTCGLKGEKKEKGSVQPCSSEHRLVDRQKEFCSQSEISANSSFPEAFLHPETGKRVKTMIALSRVLRTSRPGLGWEESATQRHRAPQLSLDPCWCPDGCSLQSPFNLLPLPQQKRSFQSTLSEDGALGRESAIFSGCGLSKVTFWAPKPCLSTYWHIMGQVAGVAICLLHTMWDEFSESAPFRTIFRPRLLDSTWIRKRRLL